MNNLSIEILLLSQISSAIASDDFGLIENKIKNYKKREFAALKLYESILQSYLFCGFPAAIESLKIFRSYYKEFSLPKTAYNLSKFKSSGKINCKLIYKKNYKKLIENMNSYSPDLKEWMILEGYGKVLSRKGLTLLERELINVSILCTRLYENQLHSHLKGSLHLGATKIQLKQLLNNLKAFVDQNNINRAMDLVTKI